MGNPVESPNEERVTAVLVTKSWAVIPVAPMVNWAVFAVGEAAISRVRVTGITAGGGGTRIDTGNTAVEETPATTVTGWGPPLKIKSWKAEFIAMAVPD